MSNTNVNISNRLLTYVKHGVDITQDMKNIYSNSLILIGDEQQIYVPVLNAYVGIGTAKFQEAINSALNGCPWEIGKGDFSIQSKNTGSIASGAYSVAEGLYTQTSNNGEHAEGKYNKSNTNTLSSIGIGNSPIDRKNAFEVDKNGYIFTYNISNYNIDYYNKRYNGTNPLPGENDLKTILDNKKDKILLKKEFNYTCSASNSANGYIFFGNIVPLSDYGDVWYIKYKLYVDLDSTNSSYTQYNQYCHGVYDCCIGVSGTSLIYHIYNQLFSGSYYPIYYHLLAYYTTTGNGSSQITWQTKYNNRETNPIKVGVRVQSAYRDTDQRHYKIEVYEIYNCRFSFTDNIETYGNVYTDAKYGACTVINATSNGLQETSDSNTPNYYNYEYYVGYRIHGADTPLYRYKFVGFDERNHLVPITITEQTNATIIDKVPCNVPIIVSRGLALYNTTTEISTGKKNIDSSIATGVLYRDSSVLSGILPYNLNTAITANNDVYLVGNYNPETDEFTLDTSVDDNNKHTKYYNIVPIVIAIGDFKNYFETGKYYWYLGQIPTNASYFNFQQSNHTLFYFNGENLIPINAKNVYDNPWERGTDDFSIQSKNTGSIASGSYSLAHGNNSVALGAYSEAGGLHTTANAIGSHTEGFETITGGDYTYNPNTTTIGANDPGSFAHAEGRASIASGGVGSHAEGNKTVAAGKAAHSEGSITTAIGNYSHTEGVRTISYAAAGHAEGQLSVSYDSAAHAEGFNSYAISPRSHAEGLFGYAYGWASHAEGSLSQALGDGSHAEGDTTISYGLLSHAEGQGTVAHGFTSHAEIGSWVNTIKITGDINATQYTGTIVSSELSSFYKSGHISLSTLKNIYEASFITWIDDYSQYIDINKPLPVKIKTVNFIDNGDDTISFTLTTETTLSSKKAISDLEVYVMMAIAYGSYSHMESGSIAYGGRTHTEGRDTIAIGTGSHAEGHHVITRGEGSHGEGFWTATYGTGSHVEGEYTYSIGIASHAEGHLSYSSGMYSHAEGNTTRASGESSHAEGQGNSASGQSSHAEGYNNIASGYNSHAEGYNTRASGENSHSEGYNTKAYGSISHAEGGGSIANQP